MGIIKSKGKILFTTKQAFYPLDYNFLLKVQTDLFQCVYCGKFIKNGTLSKDHVYPRSKGGTTTAPCCLSCNYRKRDLKPIEWVLYAYEKGFDIAAER